MEISDADDRVTGRTTAVGLLFLLHREGNNGLRQLQFNINLSMSTSMEVTNLSSIAIKQLIARYEMELDKLNFQRSKTEQTIKELRSSLSSAEKREAREMKASLNGGKASRSKQQDSPSVSDVGGEPDSPATGQAEKPARAKRGRKKGSTSRAASGSKRSKKAKGRSGGYRLSEYDEMIFAALNDKSQVLITSDLQDYIESEMKGQGKNVSEEEIRLKISRSLQKLVNRRKEITKVSYEGRGFAYALPEWVNKDGEVKRKFRR